MRGWPYSPLKSKPQAFHWQDNANVVWLSSSAHTHNVKCKFSPGSPWSSHNGAFPSCFPVICAALSPLPYLKVYMSQMYNSQSGSPVFRSCRFHEQSWTKAVPGCVLLSLYLGVHADRQVAACTVWTVFSFVSASHSADTVKMLLGSIKLANRCITTHTVLLTCVSTRRDTAAERFAAGACHWAHLDKITQTCSCLIQAVLCTKYREAEIWASGFLLLRKRHFHVFLNVCVGQWPH